MMAKRVNISIPEDLHGRLEAAQSKMNVSRICQDAIKVALELESIRESAPEIGSLIERLKSEKEGTAMDLKIEGFNDGMMDAHKMSYVEIVNFWDHQDIESHKELFEWVASEEVKAKFKSPDFKNKFKNFSVDEPFERYLDVYLKGWNDGVLDVLNKIKKELNLNIVS